MKKQFNKEDLKTCKLSRLEISQQMNMKYPTLCSKVNGYIQFDSEELELIQKIIRDNQIKLLTN